MSEKKIGTTTSFSGTGSLVDQKDTYLFTLPTINDIINDFNTVGREFVDVQPIGYDASLIFTTLNEPAIVSFGVDSNNNGIFEDNEIIAKNTINPSDVGSELFVNPLSIINTDLSLEDNLLDFGQQYFLELESTNTTTSNDYLFDFNASTILVGEIDKNDPFYNFRRQKYYYDQLDEFALKDGDFDNLIGVGDEFFISVISEMSLDPVIFLLNQDTNQVIDVAYEAQSVSLGSNNYNVVQLDFTLQADITYTLSIESAQAEQTGTYYLSFASL
ncbi:MAG: hypothetical protein QNJ47_15870 [Nostocaceae cyanobacterium]|nr:hypothetical protein [Nostocaceae cyanobacterium]